MNLGEKQRVFSGLIAKLIIRLQVLGYEVTLGEAWRPPETARFYAANGVGIVNSLHTQRLAMDLNLFKGDRFLVKSEEYEEAGAIWESFSTEEYKCVWGGRFHDGNHFSIEHGSVR